MAKAKSLKRKVAGEKAEVTKKFNGGKMSKRERDKKMGRLFGKARRKARKKK
jgi:hypothetical protein